MLRPRGRASPIGVSLDQVDSTGTTSPSRLSELRKRFGPAFEDIRDGSAERDQTRTLPFEELRRLADLGFGAVRVPVEFGGFGASLGELFELIMDLGAADPNVAQALRGHFGFVERLHLTGQADAGLWFARIAQGALIGNAQAERNSETAIHTVLTPDGAGWLLNGDKYYTTGTIYADWTWLNAGIDGRNTGVIVSTRAAGVNIVDDWDGFGQKLSGSGTTRFDDVAVSAEQVYPLADDPAHLSVDNRIVLHLILHATMAGIGQALLRDAVEYVRGRTRTFGVAGTSEPRNDAPVQLAVGELASLVFGAEAVVRNVVRELEQERAAAPGTEEDRLERYSRLHVLQFEAQQVVIRSVLEAANTLFEVGGASAVSAGRGLDRHWRNARTIASHNPAMLRQRAIGDYYLNGTAPEPYFR